MRVIFALFIIAGLLLITYFILLTVLRKQCTVMVDGVYTKHNVYKGYGGTGVFVKNYAPVFGYEYDDEFLEEQTFQMFSKKKFAKMNFNEGEVYKVYVNPKAPFRVAAVKKIQASEIIVLLIGIAFVAIGVIGML